MRRLTSRLCSLLLFALVLLAASFAHADEASIAFNEGKRLFGKRQYAESCAQFAKAEAAAGPNVKTRYWTGRCKEEQDKKAAAYLAYRDAKRMAIKAGDTKRAEVIDQRIVELGQILPFLVLTVPPAMRDVEGLTVMRNGEAVPETLWDQPLPVDMGKHEITVSAPGYKDVTLKVTASEPGSKAELVIPTLQKVDAGPAPNPDGTPKPPTGGPPPPPPGEVEMERKNAGLWGTGIGLVSAGGLAVLVGGVFLIIGALEDSTDDFDAGRPSCEDDPDNFFCVDEPVEEEGGQATPTGAGLLVTGVVFLGVGIPFIVVFGKKVPAEPDESGFSIEPVITPGGFKLRGTF